MMRTSDWRLPLLKSIGLHGLLLAVLLLGWESVPTPRPSPPEPAEVIEAVAVDETAVERELERIEAREKAREEAQQALRDKLKRQRLVEERRLRELRRKQREEKRRLEALAEARRKKAEEEAKRLAELKKRQREEKERLARLEKKRQEAERRRKAEEEKRRRAEEARRKEIARKKALEAKRREEARRKAQAEARRKAALARQKEVDRKVELAKLEIRQQVERRWIRPSSYKAGMSCTIRVRVIPGGEVVEARVVRSSGQAAFDRSAEVAVRKASPLPIPADPDVAARFREFSFVFRPEG